MSHNVEIRQSSERPHTSLCTVTKLNHFYLMSSCTGKYKTSSVFYIGQYPWTLRVFPTGYDHNHKEYIGIGFYLKNEPALNLAALSGSHFTVSITGKDGKTYSAKSALFENQSSRSILFKDFVLKQDLLNDPNLLSNDELKILFEVTINPSNTKQVSTSSQKSLPECLGKIFDAGKYTDFTFVVEGKKFEVHRAILAARSPVFEAMFDSQMRESNEGQVEIADVEAKVMEKLLRFLYTSELEDIKDVVDKVFVAAEKYQIDELKEKCEEFLVEQLSATNVYDYLRLADKYNGLRLKMKAIEFFHSNAEALTADSDFKALVDALPAHLKTDIIFILMTNI